MSNAESLDNEMDKVKEKSKNPQEIFMSTFHSQRNKILQTIVLFFRKIKKIEIWKI